MSPALIACTLLASAGVSQDFSAIQDHPVDVAHRQQDAWPFANVVHDEPGDGRLWARGASWKASFGREGFVHIPFLAGAPRNHPLHFRLQAVRVGGQALPFAADAVPVRTQDRVSFDRGAVREIYDLRLHEVEQTFVVDTGLAGDVEVELAIGSDLCEDASKPGLQFGCEFGEVAYGDAFLVREQQKLAIDSQWASGVIRLRVPAALRGAGPVVIDPIIGTQPTSTIGRVSVPDVAYDATNDRYLVVWESEFSVTDHDVWSEMFDGLGNLIPDSRAAIDVTSTDYRDPHVANQNQNDRFLVVADVADPQRNLRHMIYGRTRDAGASMPLAAPVLLSDPALPGDNFLPDVGGDPGTNAGNHDWLVTWSKYVSETDAIVQGRLVRSDGQPRSAAVIPIQQSLGDKNWYPQVSRSNGNGFVANAQWLVAYARPVQFAGHNVYARGVDPAGSVTNEFGIAEGADDDRFPRVSSPFDQDGRTCFAVLNRRASPLTARAAIIRFHNGNQWQGTHFHDLTALFGIGADALAVDSDGARFTVTCNGPAADMVQVRTLGFTGSGLELHDGPQSLPGNAHDPEVASKRSSGGVAGDYAIAFTTPAGSLQRTMLTRYAGLTPGPMLSVMPTACSGLAIAVAGTPVLGNSLVFTLSNFAADLPAFLFGAASSNPVPICPGCSLGVRLDLPMQTLFGSATASIAIPTTVQLVGLPLAMQGFSIGSGSCFGGFAFADTIQFTIR